MRERVAMLGGTVEAGSRRAADTWSQQRIPIDVRRVSIRVLIADDQALVRSGFRLIVETRPDLEVVGEAENGEEAVALAASSQPDVVLLDIRMPVLDGIEATRRIVASGSPARILVLTTFDLDEYVYAAIRAGASGFLLKDVRPLDLVDAIRLVAAEMHCSARRSRSVCSSGSPTPSRQPCPEVRSMRSPNVRWRFSGCSRAASRMPKSQATWW